MEAVDLTQVYLENALKQCVCVLLLPIVQIYKSKYISGSKYVSGFC